jgi:hypothetical protein
LKSGLRIVKKHNILREGQHRLTVTLTIRGEDGKQAQTCINVDYNQGKFAKFPQILDIDATDWTISET